MSASFFEGGPGKQPEPLYANGNFDGNAYRVSAGGWTYIDGVGTHKPITGEGPAPGGYPAPGLPKYSAIGKVERGRMFVQGLGFFTSTQFFPMGSINTCMQYVGTQAIIWVQLNDDNLGDNSPDSTLAIYQWQ